MGEPRIESGKVECNCDAFPIIHSHINTDEESSIIRPDIKEHDE